MAVTTDQATAWCRQLVDKAPDFPELDECLKVIPSLDSLADLPAGTRVLVRGDVDVVIDEQGNVEEDVRLRSLLETLSFGHSRGWVQILYGHRGRDPEMSLKPVADYMQKLIEEAGLTKARVSFAGEWLDNKTGKVLDAAKAQIAQAAPGSVVVLENTRRYDLETALWKAKAADLAPLAERLTNYANTVSEKLARVHVNEGFAASNRDLSSTLVPLTMERVALGSYIDTELRRHVTRARQAELVIFSGLKINKLDDLEQILKRGRVKMVIAAGALAIALKKAAEPDFEIGLAADPAQKIFLPPERVEQARRMLEQGRQAGVEFVLPVDFILGDGTASATIPAGGAQFDVGPKTIALHAEKVGQFIQYGRGKTSRGQPPAVAFHNGVFGKFEEDRFSHGTRKFMEQLKRMTQEGVEVYVGGGEGGAALVRYGDESWVTHCFTAGGTILKALGVEPIPYIKALYQKCRR